MQWLVHKQKNQDSPVGMKMLDDSPEDPTAKRKQRRHLVNWLHQFVDKKIVNL